MERLDFEALAELEARARIDRRAESALWEIVERHLREQSTSIAYVATTLAKLFTDWKGLRKTTKGEFRDTLHPISLSAAFARLTIERTRDDMGKVRKKVATQKILKNDKGEPVLFEGKPVVLSVWRSDLTLLPIVSLPDKRDSAEKSRQLAADTLRDMAYRAGLADASGEPLDTFHGRVYRALLAAGYAPRLSGDIRATLSAALGVSESSAYRAIEEILEKLRKV